MKRKTLLALFNLSLAFGLMPLARAENNTFTYQGKLVDDCCPANGFYEMRFKLCSASGGAQVSGTPIVPHTLFVTNGLFTTNLNFGTGSQVFDGNTRWLEIEVRTNNPLASFVALLPRTELSRTPEAVFAQKAASVLNNAIKAQSIDSGQVVKSLNGLKDDVTLSAGANITLTPSGNNLEISASAAGSYWSLTGNAGTTPGVNFLGTTDGQPLEIRAPSVGLGTAAPGGKLHVFGNSAPGANIPTSTTVLASGDGFNNRFMSVYGNQAAYLSLWHGGYGELSTYDYGTGSGLPLALNVNGGNVGIGTTRPEAKLHVVLQGEGTAVRGVHPASGIYGELATVTQVGEFPFRAAVYGYSPNDYAGYFDGDVNITGDLQLSGVVSGGMNVLGPMNVTTYNSPAAIYAYNAKQDFSAAGVRGECAAGVGVEGQSSWIGVSAHNYSSDKHAFLATANYAGQFNGDVIIRGNGPGQPANLTVTGNACANTFSVCSDRHMKTNFATVDPRDILRRVVTLKVQRWSFTNDSGALHLGPMAQDFHAAFGVGLDDKSICTVDADGVALAAIQALHQLLQEKETQTEELKAKVAELADAIATLTAQK